MVFVCATVSVSMCPYIVDVRVGDVIILLCLKGVIRAEFYFLSCSF